MADQGGVVFTADLAERVMRAVRTVETMQGRRPPGDRAAPAGAPVTVTVRVVGTTIAANIASGAQTVTPASMSGIFVGAVLVIDTGTPQETVTVTAIAAATFTATFAKSHTGPGIAVAGAANDNGYYPACVTQFTPLMSTWIDLGAVSVISPNGAVLPPGPARCRATPAGVDPTDGITAAFLALDSPATAAASSFVGCRLDTAANQVGVVGNSGYTAQWRGASGTEVLTQRFDHGGFFSAGTPTLLAVPNTGYYLVDVEMGVINWAPTSDTLAAGDVVYMSINKAEIGSPTWADVDIDRRQAETGLGSSGLGVGVRASCCLSCVAGDQISVYLFAPHQASIDPNGGSNWISIVQVG